MKKILLFAIFLVALLTLTSCGNTRCEGGCMPGEYVRTVESTCATHGYELYACPECGFETDRKELPLVACQEGNWYTSISPTCTQTGLKTLPCQWCGKEMDTETLEPQGHNVENVSTWATISNPTCVRAGKEEGTCPACSQSITREIPATGHIKSEEWVTKTEATCTTKGERIKKCIYSSCSEVMENEELPALNHEKAEEWATTVPFTCTTDGEEAKKCVRCPEIMETRAVEAHHVKVTLPAVETTCSAPGKTEGLHCSACKEVFTQQETIPQLPHAWVIDPYVAPTCQNYGYTEGSHCDSCKKWQVEPTKISKLPHQTATDKGYAATCTSTGKTDGTHCTVCKKTIKAQATISALGHNFDVFTNTCARCPEKELFEIKDVNSFQNHDYDLMNKAYFLEYCYDIEEGRGWRITVESDEITHLRLIGVLGEQYNLIFEIKERTLPLKIDFVNTQLTIFSGYTIINSASSAAIDLNFFGTECGLYGANGSNGANGSLGSQNGKNGANGSCAVEIGGTLNINISCTKVKLQGGNGGNGGQAFGPCYIGTNYGGNGGNGAYAISASSIFIRAASGYSTSNLTLIKGYGGAAGAKDGRGTSAGNPGKDAPAATNVTVQYK